MTTRRLDTDDRRERILAAALDCFVSQGYHGTAVPEVAKKAGMAAGTMYHYFPSKQALVNAVFRKWKEAIAARVFLAFPARAPVREQFRVMWREMTEFALAHPSAFAFLELHHHRSYLDDESLAMENRLKDFAAMVVGQAQARGEIKAGPTRLLMELVFGAFIGMMRAHGDGRIELTPETRTLAEQAGWDAIAARGEATQHPAG
jgi:AcrR family transcriptional regulator